MWESMCAYTLLHSRVVILSLVLDKTIILFCMLYGANPTRSVHVADGGSVATLNPYPLAHRAYI
jgi:hypothetical protein